MRPGARLLSPGCPGAWRGATPAWRRHRDPRGDATNCRRSALARQSSTDRAGNWQKQKQHAAAAGVHPGLADGLVGLLGCKAAAMQGSGEGPAEGEAEEQCRVQQRALKLLRGIIIIIGIVHGPSASAMGPEGHSGGQRCHAAGAGAAAWCCWRAGAWRRCSARRARWPTRRQRRWRRCSATARRLGSWCGQRAGGCSCPWSKVNGPVLGCGRWSFNDRAQMSRGRS
jgi:hypothetical protein